MLCTVVLLAYTLDPQDFPGGSDGKASACSAEDLGLIPGSGRSSGEGNGNPLQYSYLENPMDRGARWATVRGVTKSWTQLSDFTFTLILKLDLHCCSQDPCTKEGTCLGLVDLSSLTGLASVIL